MHQNDMARHHLATINASHISVAPHQQRDAVRGTRIVRNVESGIDKAKLTGNADD